MSGVRRRLARRRASAPDPDSQWFWDHYNGASRELIRFCGDAGLNLEGLKVADVGCGDGILSLGVMHHARPAQLVGFDIVPTDVDALLSRARERGVADALPPGLSFEPSEPTRIPAEDGRFDVVYSWSAFEHIADPAAVLREIHRIVAPGGCFFLQLWPFYHSAKGSHLWPFVDADFHHLLDSEDEVVRQVRASQRHPEHWTEYMLKEFRQLNRVTVDELQKAVLEAGFAVHRLELLTHPVQLDPALSGYAWSDLAVGGVKLLARPI